MIGYLEEKEKSMLLYKKCFDDSESYCRYYFESLLKQNQVAVCEENGEIQGMIHLIPKQIRLGREDVVCQYLYGVATDFRFRRQGVMRKILCQVLRDLYDNQDCFTYLIPSSEKNAEIYQKYGFGFVMDKMEEKKNSVEQDRVIEEKLAKRSDIPSLSIYAKKKMEETYDIYLQKSPEYFNQMFSLLETDDGYIQIFLEDGEIAGYRILDDGEVLEEVLDSSIQKLTWMSQEKRPYVMARLLHIERTLQKLETKSSGCTAIKVFDPVISENRGTFLWKYGQENISWERTKQKADMEIDISDFTAHVLGYIKIKGLPEMKKKKGFFISDYV